MDNRGFGLSELLVFIGIFLFILVAVAIYGRVKLGNESFYTEPDVDINKQENVNDSIEIIIPKEYIKLENSLNETARKYNISKDKDQIITLKELQTNNLIGNIVDPNDNSIMCNGYVEYYSNLNQYTSYINCPGMYVTNLYNYEYEKN